MSSNGNKHADIYSVHHAEVGHGCSEILRRLKYDGRVAIDYDSIRWRGPDNNYWNATIGATTVRVHSDSKMALETCIPLCQRRGATYVLSRSLYEMDPWFISRQAIWYADAPRDAGQVTIYTTPPRNLSEIKNGFVTHPFVAMNTAALYFRPTTAQFVDQWGNSGMNFKAMLTPAP